MMSLVAYGSSDDESGSESDGDEVVLASKVKPQTQSRKSHEATDSKDGVKSDVGTSKVDEKLSTLDGPVGRPEMSTKKDLFSRLPAPSSTSSVIVLKSSILPGNKSSLQRRGPVKISIPSLPEFDDTDEPPAKKSLQQPSKGTKLTSMLPPPKGTVKKEVKTTLVPNSVARKPTPAHFFKPQSVVKAAPSVLSRQSHDDSGDDSGSEDTGADFFSLATDYTVPSADDASSINTVTSCNQDLLITEGGMVGHSEQQSSNYDLTEAPDILGSSGLVGPQADSGQDYIPFESTDLQLDEEAMQKLCGRKGRRNQENVQIIDVNGDAIMPDSREWLTKQLTEEKPRASSHRKKDGPSSQQRRKHQITYLAFQAKENELELQNQWANNRQSRRQTQSKYGF